MDLKLTGGLHLALTRAQSDAEVVQAFDWDQTACQVYNLNYGNIVKKVCSCHDFP